MLFVSGPWRCVQVLASLEESAASSRSLGVLNILSAAPVFTGLTEASRSANTLSICQPALE